MTKVNDHRLRFQKLLIRFLLCQVEWKTKLWIFVITLRFRKCFTDYDMGSWALRKVCNPKIGHGVAAQPSLPFPGMEKNETSNISGTMSLIFFILSPCVWEQIMVYYTKIIMTTLTSQIKVILRVTFHSRMVQVQFISSFTLIFNFLVKLLFDL